MTLITEIVEEKPTVLIVSKKDHHFVSLLKSELKRYKAEVFFSSILPSSLAKFDYCFLLNAETLPQKKFFPAGKKIALIFINNLQQARIAVNYYQNTFVKIISITGDKISKNHIDKLLWFTFSQSQEQFLQFTAPENITLKKIPQYILKIRMPSRKKLFMTVIALFLFLHVAFLPPLLISSYLISQAATYLRQEKFQQVEQFLSAGELSFSLVKKIYRIPRSTFLLFSFTLFEDFFDINDKAYLTIRKSLKLRENVQGAFKTILKHDQTAEDKRQLLLRIDTIKKDIDFLEENIGFLSQKVPYQFSSSQKIRSDLISYLDLLSRLKPILKHTDSLLAKDSVKTYLLLFANNMELRPGGGFIGSFGLLQVKDYSVQQIKIYDVYDADGQLIAHVDPPDPIRDYLGQPHWFLRDSAFSPDFLENYVAAKFFLEKEMGFDNFSGSILVTTSAIQNILGAFGDLYLPDFKEKINQKNFYLKTQYYSEKDFFPGSIQKKNFLSSITQSLLINLENASPLLLATEFKKSLDEKQIVIYFDDPKVQKVVDSLYWSGRTIKAPCGAEVKNCVTDYAFPFDANVGLNKANFFVSRSFDLKVTIDEEGAIHNVFSIVFNNDSQDVYPGGPYRNYHQLYLPKSVLLKNITLDGVQIENYSEEVDQYKKIGLLLEIKPKTVAELKMSYDLEENIKKGKNVYQLIVQKQIGAQNSDLVIRINLPENIHLINQNFSALVKDNQIIYNTSLSADKIFFVELIKE